MNPFIASLSGSPILVAPEREQWFASCIQGLTNKVEAVITQMAGAVDENYWDPAFSYFRPYNVQDGVLTIPVQGALLNGIDFKYFDAATGYPYIRKAFDRGLADSNVKAIVFNIDSPGGQVSGNFDLVDHIFNNRGEKPIEAVANENAYSAAYSIASAAEKITVARTGGVGSIGVVTMHLDMSKALEDRGLKVTFIYAGKHKVDGNPYEPLAEDVKNRIQESINKTYNVFVATVARNRGVDEKAVRNTEALTYDAEDALSVGLADSIGTYDDAVAAVAAQVKQSEGSLNMSVNPNAAAEQLEAAKTEAKTAGLAEGAKIGATAEKARISAILALAEATDRRDAAVNIALTTDLSVDQAKSLLATLPEHKKKAEENAFVAAMSNSDNPNLGVGAEAPAPESRAKQIVAAYHSYVGKAK